jgi:hypothetical protein
MKKTAQISILIFLSFGMYFQGFSQCVKPNPPVTQNITACEGDYDTSLCAIGEQITWYKNPDKTELLSKGNCFFPWYYNSESDTYYATQTINGCESDVSEAIMTINQTPFTIIIGDSVVCVHSESVKYRVKLPNSENSYFWEVTGNNLNYSKDENSKNELYIDWEKQGFDTLTIMEITPNSCIGRDSVVVQIANYPKANFTWQISEKNDEIEFANATVQDSISELTPDGFNLAFPMSYKMFWSFGDTVEYVDRNISIIKPYSEIPQSVELKAENEFGCVSTIQQIVRESSNVFRMTEDELYLNIPQESTNVSVTISNELGVSVLHSTDTIIDISSLERGIYMCVVETSEGSYRQKLLVQ